MAGKSWRRTAAAHALMSAVIRFSSVLAAVVMDSARTVATMPGRSAFRLACEVQWEGRTARRENFVVAITAASSTITAQVKSVMQAAFV